MSDHTLTYPSGNPPAEPSVAASPIDDLPYRLVNSVSHTLGPGPTGTINLPADSNAQWELVRWCKSRGGLAIADLYGPTWVAGGQVGQVGPFTLEVTAVEAWPLQEVVGFQRTATLVRLATTQTVTVDGSSPEFLIAVMAQGFDGEVRAFPVQAASATAKRLYRAFGEDATLAVPLATVIVDPMHGIQAIWDLRTPAGGWALTENRYVPFTTQDVVEGAAQDYIKRTSLRLWVVASAGDLIEVAALGGLHGSFINVGSSTGIGTSSARHEVQACTLTMAVNGELMDGGSLDATGCEAVTGLTSVTGPSIFYHGSAHTKLADAFDVIVAHHVVLRSKVDAIHDLAVGVKSAHSGTDGPPFGAIATQLQLCARRLPRAPILEA